MRRISFLLVCIVTCLVMGCGSDSDSENKQAEEAMYTQGDFMALYHGTPQVVANIVTGGKVELGKWYDLLSLFTEEDPALTRGPVGQVLSLVQFAGKCRVVSKDANLDVYMRLKSMGVSYKDMFDQIEPEHRDGCENAEEWEIAMNQGRITDPWCFSDLATAYALELEADKGYNQYRYKILANTAVELAEEGVNVIASFDSDMGTAKTTFDFVNATLSGDYETFSSKVSGLISETGGEVSDAALYAFKAYMDYCMDNRETSFTWIPKNDSFFSGYWYEKIDEKTEYEYDIWDENDIKDETMYRSKWEKDNDKRIGSDYKMSCTLYCGKEFIFYIKDNGKVTPYRIINTAGDYVTSKDAFFYMVEVGGTTKRLWRRRQHYSHETPEVPPVKETNMLVGAWISFSNGGWYWSPSELVKSTVSFNADSTWSCRLFHTPEGGAENFYGEAQGRWDVKTYRPEDGIYNYILYVSQVYCLDRDSNNRYLTWIPSNGKDYKMTYMSVDFDESGNTMRITDQKLTVALVNSEHPNWDATSIWIPFNYQVDYTKQEE